MSSCDAVAKVASLANISDHYINAWGTEAKVSDTTIFKLLNAMGYDTSSPDALLHSADKHHSKDVLEPVLVFSQGMVINVPLALQSSARPSDFSWRMTTEQGQVLEGYLQSQVVADRRDEGKGLEFLIPGDLPLGYHTLELFRKRRKTPYVASIIMTPPACYKQPSLNDGLKMWGPSIQLYSLRSAHNWGMGDFGDLKQLVSEVAARGGDFVGLNPIHALFPANPEAASPYSPSSRRWLNVLYIDVCSVAEFSLSKAAQQLVGSSEFQHRLQMARESHWVNYTDVARMKLTVLPFLYQEFKQRHLAVNSDRAQSFLTFVEDGGESLLQQATFDALHAQLNANNDNVWGWPVFPERYQNFNSKAVQRFAEKNNDDIQFYMYLQWIADSQIKDVQSLATDKGMHIGLYRDLAVGVAESGVEAWADSGSLVQGVSTGAPPDILGPLGQSWGLPPFHPQRLRETAYQAFIDLLRANMSHCGTLRIDHILGLMRLWWVPKEEPATQGAYVHYPVEDMLSILALESHRQKCSVIGEDLGTVPDKMREKLHKAGVYSYKVFFFERSQQDGGYLSPAHYAQQSMSALCTHDMPTLRGFWHCEDLKMGQELGLYPDEEQLQQLFDDRLVCKQNILDSIRWHGLLPESVGKQADLVPMDRYLCEALQLHLGLGASALQSVQLEDWLEMDKPVNIPGTVSEYPNWRRKLSVGLEEMFANEYINRLSERLSEVRIKASTVDTGLIND